MFPIFTLSGISYGMVELIRRVIPTDIVGGDTNRVGGVMLLFVTITDFIGVPSRSLPPLPPS
jgi:hypothetical protein